MSFPYIHRHPVWFMNFCISQRSDDYSMHLGALEEWAPTIHEWIDKTMVRGNEDSEAVVRVLWKVYRRIAAFELIQKGNTPYEGIRSVVWRLKGLR